MTKIPPHRRFAKSLRSMDANQWLTLMVAFASLGVAIASYLNSADTRELQGAVGRLAELAKQTKRNGDFQGRQLAIMSAQRPFVERQANAAADAATAAKISAGAAKGQTDAILRQADALIRSAQASINATSAQLSAAKAQQTSAQAISVSAAEGTKAAELQQRTAGLLASSRVPVAKISFVDIQGWVSKPNPDGSLSLQVKPTFTNVGGGTLLPRLTSFHFGFLSPQTKFLTNDEKLEFGGNEFPIPPGQDYYPVNAFRISVRAQEFRDAQEGRLKIIVWGTVRFADANGTQYQACYLDFVNPPKVGEAGGSVTPLDLRKRDFCLEMEAMTARK